MLSKLNPRGFFGSRVNRFKSLGRTGWLTGGLAVAAVGLAFAVRLIAQLGNGLMAGVPLSDLWVPVTVAAAAAFVLVGSGFAMMVRGSDPWTDAAPEQRDFPDESIQPEFTLQGVEGNVSVRDSRKQAG